jgi:hypothetical protein
VFSVNNNLLSFIVFVLVDIKGFLVVDIDEVLSFIGEDLPPFQVRLSAPDLHVRGSS